MSMFFPRVAYVPARCGPVRHEIAPLFSLFDDTFNELQRATRHGRRQFNPRFDVKEAKDSYSLEGELPGVDQKDIAIEFTDEHTLTIKGRTQRHVESGKRPEAETKAVEAEAATGESSSTKSHQPSVEDEEPANASAAADENATAEKIAEPEQTTPAPEKSKSEPQQQYWISERSVGSFSRSFNFPARVDQEAVRASLKNGILSIVIPKAPVPESRRVNIE